MSKRNSSFVEQAAKGLVQLTDIDDFIDQWHRDMTDLSLDAYLGMSAKEYANWVNHPEVLQFIVDAQRNRPLARVSERELVLPALRIAAGRRSGEVTTSDLVSELIELFDPTGEDSQVLKNKNDTKFSQKVRNLVLHRDGASSMFGKGYAEYTGDGIRITEKGRVFLKSVPEFELS